MFQFPGFASYYPIFSGNGDRSSTYRVSPFGYLQIIAYLQLPEAFRRSLRPSSAPSAKASSVRPY
jgi:hypothetical protein